MNLIEPEWYEVPQYWPVIEPWVAAALSHGGLIFTPEDIRKHLLTRGMKLWIAMDGDAIAGCCVARIEQYERSRVCSILIIGGRGSKNWLRFSDAVEDWGRAMGADCAQGVGRFGWERKSAPLGYKPIAVIYRKKL